MTPTAIHDHRQRRVLEFVWPDGATHCLDYGVLRQLCPCARCRSERVARGVEVVAPADASVTVAALEPVGVYGVQIVFSDGHERGIFPWTYLREQSERVGG